MKLSSLLSLGIVALTAPGVMAQTIIYQQNFDTATAANQTAGPADYVGISDISGTGWQVQGGSDGTVALQAGIDNSGVGGSQGLYGLWDFSGGVSFTWNQYTYYGTPAPGAGVNLADIRVSLDLAYTGSDTPPPVTVSTLQDGGNVERTFSPTLTAGDFTHVEFSLADMSGPAFDPTMGFWFRVSHGNGGFGLDTGNSLHIDNVLITIVPEPASSALLGLGILGLAIFRRRS